MELRQAMIFAKDMAVMTAFYRDGLGLRMRLDKSRGDWVEFEAGGSLLALHAIPPEIAKDIDITSPPRRRESTPIKLIFETDDLDGARAHLARHGAVMDQPRSRGSCDGLDPEGNVFSIVART